MLPLTRFSSVSGIPLHSLLSKDKLDALIQDTRQVAAKVIEQKGATIHAPGNAISSIIESVVRDQKKVIPVATALDGEYGFSNIIMGVPAVIGKNGVEKIIELELNDAEKAELQKSADSVKNAISSVNL
jgi:malate dehydrogenase